MKFRLDVKSSAIGLCFGVMLTLIALQNRFRGNTDSPVAVSYVSNSEVKLVPSNQVQSKSVRSREMSNSEVKLVPTGQVQSKSVQSREITFPVYTFDEKWTKDYDICNSVPLTSFVKAPLIHIKNPMKMFVMDPKKDSISRIIISTKMFDKVDFDVMYRFFGNKSDYHFVDVGANVGVHSLKFADVGKRVFSIEVSKDLVQRLCGSVHINNFQNRLTIINNPIGADHGNITYVKSKGDYGFNFVEEEHTKKVMLKAMGEKFYASREVQKLITLDDLLDLPTFDGVKKVFLKVDVEGFEHKVIMGSSKFFQAVEVGGMYMEWNKQGAYETGEIIIKAMQERGFEPYHCPQPNNCKYLDDQSVRKSIYNIIWLPKGTLKHD